MKEIKGTLFFLKKLTEEPKCGIKVETCKKEEEAEINASEFAAILIPY